MRHIYKIFIALATFALSHLALVALSAHAGVREDFEVAVRKDDTKTVTTLLLRGGVDVNMRDESNLPMLHLAIREESYKVAELLIGMNALKVEARTPQDENALMMAALRGHERLSMMLIARGADVNKTGWAPLHYAATNGHVHIMRLLRQHHAYLDAESPNKTTPLMMAAMYGTPEAVKYLIDEGADVTLVNDLGVNALDFAIKADRLDAQKILEPLIRAKKPKGTW